MPPGEASATIELSDFTTTARLIPIAGLASLIGLLAAYIAAALLKLIGLFTNLFFFQRIETTLVSPAGHQLGPFVIWCLSPERSSFASWRGMARSESAATAYLRRSRRSSSTAAASSPRSRCSNRSRPRSRSALADASEDAFLRLPIHWMWWPAIGGLAIGIGGLLQGELPLRIIVGVLIVKSSIWAFSLGSGTSGGVLAPLLMIGGALGGVESRFLPVEGIGF